MKLHAFHLCSRPWNGFSFDPSLHSFDTLSVSQWRRIHKVFWMVNRIMVVAELMQFIIASERISYNYCTLCYPFLNYLFQGLLSSIYVSYQKLPWILIFASRSLYASKNPTALLQSASLLYFLRWRRHSFISTNLLLPPIFLLWFIRRRTQPAKSLSLYLETVL